MLGSDGLMPFAREQSARQGHECGKESEGGTKYGVLVLFRASYPPLQIGEGEEGDKAHGICPDHTESGELVFLVIVSSHNIE